MSLEEQKRRNVCVCVCVCVCVRERVGWGGGREGGTCLQHGVTVCIGDVYLQSSKLGIIVVAKIKHLNPCNHDNRYTEAISMVTRAPLTNLA